MPVRPRNHKNKSLPPNLYTNPLRYRHPKTGKIHSWRKYTLEKAIEAAKILNSMLISSDPVSDVLGDKNSFGKFIEEFKETHLKERKAERNLSDVTIADYERKLAVLEKKPIAKKSIVEVDTYDLATLLKDFPTTQRNRYRSLLILIFDYAISEGLTATNPARSLMKKMENVKRRRLTIEGFNAVVQGATKEKDLPTINAMRLALRSLQRREDLVALRFADLSSDEKGKFLPLIQEKTKSAIKIYLDKGLQEDIETCRDSVASPFILHYGMESNKRRRAKPLTKDRLTKGFAYHRDRAEYFKDIPPVERPTFHEIRALGAILYLRAGKPIKAIQALLGHSSEEMTKRYLERHGVEFVNAETGQFSDSIEKVLHG